MNAFDANGFYGHNCGEQPLPPYGACLLGSVNLARFVDEPFTPQARLDIARLAALVPDAVRMMDNIVDISRFPLEEQRHEAQAKRRIGLGITGLADALIMCGLRYGSREAVAATEAWLGLIEREAYLASAALAAEKGPFPLFDRDKYLAGETVAALDEDVRAAIAEHGIRNALLTSVAPTGTISLFADNVSSGIEPVFSFRYTRNVLMPDGSRREEEVSDYAYRLFRRLKGETAPLPDYFVDAQSLSPEDHLVMQAAVQRHIDSSISKTINLPADIPFERFKDIYASAYAMDCKGCTTYRPNEVTGSVLEARPETPEARPQQAELPLPAPVAAAKPADIYEAGGVVYMTPAAVAARGAARPDLQDQLAGKRARALHHDQRRGAGRAPPPVRDLHQLEEHGALRLDRGADADDQRGVPPRRRRVVCRRGDEGGVRPARRRLDGGQVRALAARRDRRRDRAPHDRDRLSAEPPPRRRGHAVGAGGQPVAAVIGPAAGPAPAAMPEMRRSLADPQRKLRPVHQLRLFEMRLIAGRWRLVGLEACRAEKRSVFRQSPNPAACRRKALRFSALRY